MVTAGDFRNWRLFDSTFSAFRKQCSFLLQDVLSIEVTSSALLPSEMSW